MFTNQQLDLLQLLFQSENEGATRSSILGALNIQESKLDELIQQLGPRYVEVEGDRLFLAQDQFDQLDELLINHGKVELEEVSAKTSRFKYGHWHLGWFVLLVILWILYFVIES